MQSIVMDFYQHDSYRSLLKSLNLAAAAPASSPPDSRRNLRIVAGGKGGAVGSSSVVCSSGRPVQYCHQHPHHEKQDQLLKLLQLQQLLFPILLVMMMMMGHGANAQQAYNNVNGYTCAAQSPSCTSYALYRTHRSGENLTYVSGLFNTTAEAIANVSSSTGGLNLTANSAASLPAGTPLFIPLACNCVRRSYQGNVSRTYEATAIWTIVEGNTFFLIANNTYEGLTTYQAIEAANPTQEATDLHLNSLSTIPLRCACPSTRQVGTRFLLSFAVFPQESSLGVLSSYFNVSVADLEAANEINATTTLQPFSTLLVPLVRLPLLSSISFLPESSSSAPTAAVSPSTQLSPPSLPPSTSSSSGNGTSNKNLYVGVGIGLGIGLVVASLIGICLVLLCRRKMKKMLMMDSDAHGGGATTSSSLLLAPDVAPKTAQSDTIKEYDGGFQDVLLAEMSDVVGSDKPLIFSYEELRDATKDFSDAQRIQGSVFLGQLRGTLVAIKQMKGNMTQELKILTQVHHGNLVKLVGMCLNSEHLYVVYEYAENGSLSDCLHKEADPTSNFSRSVPFLPWTTRVQIALDVASGLDYIHNYTNPSFVHKDVKSSNILLDANFRAKVANFGMAKSADGTAAGPMLTRHIVGTQGYMAPEYLEHGLVTPKADVFAFGVVLLEILSGQEAIIRPGEGDVGQWKERVLSSQVGEILEGDNYKENLQAWMDPLLQNAYPLDTACSVAQLAKTCVDSDPALRPNMKDITYALSKMLASSLEWESSAIFGGRDMKGVSIEAR
jgi:serine/threonine protein kinase